MIEEVANGGSGNLFSLGRESPIYVVLILTQLIINPSYRIQGNLINHYQLLSESRYWLNNMHPIYDRCHTASKSGNPVGVDPLLNTKCTTGEHVSMHDGRALLVQGQTTL